MLSILAALLAGMADGIGPAEKVPEIDAGSIQTLLEIISASMLMIAVFAVGAMLAAYASASNAATPRSFPVVVADDVSQNALSTFIGAFIFSLVGLIALLNGYYGPAGRFVLFASTVFVLAAVILSFVHWVDRIARLGRLGSTIDKIEAIAAQALRARRLRPTLGALPASPGTDGLPVHARAVGYVQRIDITTLQTVAEENDLRIRVAADPGTFASPAQPLAHVQAPEGSLDDAQRAAIVEAFVIGGDRTFDDDPRFGLIVLSEIGSRALSPAVNDPGTALGILGTFVRLFAKWHEVEVSDGEAQPDFDRVAVPALDVSDMLDDAFNAIARDGAATIEVAIGLQKALRALAALGDEPLRAAAITHANFARRYAEHALALPEEREALFAASAWAQEAH